MGEKAGATKGAVVEIFDKKYSQGLKRKIKVSINLN